MDIFQVRSSPRVIVSDTLLDIAYYLAGEGLVI